MKIRSGTGTWLLIALVQSQQKELIKNDKLKLIAYKPEGRKKRGYKKAKLNYGEDRMDKN